MMIISMCYDVYLFQTYQFNKVCEECEVFQQILKGFLKQVAQICVKNVKVWETTVMQITWFDNS